MATQAYPSYRSSSFLIRDKSVRPGLFVVYTCLKRQKVHEIKADPVLIEKQENGS